MAVRLCGPIKRPEFKIVHELPRRIRLRGKWLCHPSLDLAYMQAVLEALKGVKCARINSRALSVCVTYDGDPETRRRVLLSLANIPAEAYLPDPNKDDPPDVMNVVTKGLLAAATPLLPETAKALISWYLAVPSLLAGAETLLTSGVKIEVLDASAKLFSLLRRDYFTSNAIGALLALGEHLEQASEKKSNDLLKSLLKPQADSVWIERDGLETKIPLSEVCIGETVICGPGELIPVDGTVLGGEASVNQSSITGESVPVHAQPGTAVLSGSVVHEGHIRITAEQVGAETSMARINRFLEASLRTKSSGQERSDQLADKLVPVTFATGLGIYMATGDLSRAASVLTVDYSCAIKLSNPVAVRTNMYAASKGGVLFKGAQALENLNRVDTLVFDKTGTLTSGDLKVADIVPLVDLSEHELLALAAGAEEHYNHPVARAVVAEAEAKKLELPPISQVDFIVAHGVSAYVQDQRVLVGSRHFLEDDEGVDCSAADTRAAELRSMGRSILFIARNGLLEGIIALTDNIRPEAARSLELLKECGISKIVVLTGDHRDTAKALAAELPIIDEIFWELDPEDKARTVKSLRESGHFLAFVGDGVNDAPALVSADVGICMPNGADLAREASQVVLLRESLEALVTAVKISRRTQKSLKRCALASIGINSATLALALAGLLPPVVSASIHNMSTVGILGCAALAGSRPTASESVESLDNEPMEETDVHVA